MLNTIRSAIAFLLLSCAVSLAAVPAAHAQTVPPRPLAGSVPPPYPDAALVAGIEGSVTYRALVGADGIPKSVDIADVPAKGYGFEDAVRRAVGAWRFAPATADGVPVEGVYEAVAPFTPVLPGEFVFPVTPVAAWVAVQAFARELKLGCREDREEPAGPGDQVHTLPR